MTLLFVCLLVFLSVVAPLWIIAHYATKWRLARKFDEGDERRLRDMAALADKMEERVQVIERILDAQDPNWRKKT